MEDFLGTSIQYSERQIKLLEKEYAEKMEKTAQELIDSGFLDSDYVSSSETEESQSPEIPNREMRAQPAKAAKGATRIRRVSRESVGKSVSSRDSNRFLRGSAFQRVNRLLHSHRNWMARDRRNITDTSSPSHFRRSSFSHSSSSLNGHALTLSSSSSSRGSRSMANLQRVSSLQPTPVVPERMNVGQQPAQRSNSMPNLMNGAYPTPLYSRSFCQIPPMTTIMRHFLRL